MWICWHAGALFRVYSGDVGSQEAQCIFREGDAALSNVMTQESFNTAIADAIAQLEAQMLSMYSQDELDAAVADAAAQADVAALPMLDITFLDDTTDLSGHGHTTTMGGNAHVMRDGLHFDGAGDDAMVSNFDYARVQPAPETE